MNRTFFAFPSTLDGTMTALGSLTTPALVTLTVGNHSGLVVILHYMSKCCGTCESKAKRGEKSTEGKEENEREHHTENICPCNYHGSSKGMEYIGALKSCLHLHDHHNVVYDTIVMDDDSLMENILKWKFTDALDEGLIDKIPTTAGGNKKVDNGRLPLTQGQSSWE